MKHNKKEKKNRLLDKRIFIGLLLIPVIVYILIIVPFPPSFGTTRNGWLSFFGGYAGGLATMFGVIITITKDNDRYIEEKRIEKLPFLIAEFEYEEEDKYIKFSNVGYGAAIEVKLPERLKPYSGLFIKGDYVINIPAGGSRRTIFLWDSCKVECDNFTVSYKDFTMENSYRQLCELKKIENVTYNFIRMQKQEKC